MNRSRVLAVLFLVFGGAFASPPLTIAVLGNATFSKALEKVYLAQPFKSRVQISEFRAELNRLKEEAAADPIRLAQEKRVQKSNFDTTMSQEEKYRLLMDANTIIAQWSKQELPLKTKLPIKVPKNANDLTLEEHVMLLGVIEFQEEE